MLADGKRAQKTQIVRIAATFLLLCADLSAQKFAPFHFFRYEPGQSWSVEDTFSARIRDPLTGMRFTPMARSRFRYTVETTYPDGAALVLLEAEALASGTSLKNLKPISLLPDQKPPHYLVMTRDGYVYGPFVRDMGRELKGQRDLNAWLSKRRSPWVWHKLPLWPIRVGESVVRRLGGERWSLTRLPDEKVGGVLCFVYKARLERKSIQVEETVWFAMEEGYCVKKVIQEDRTHGVVSTLVQVRGA